MPGAQHRAFSEVLFASLSRPSMLALSTKPWLSYNFQGKNHCPWLRKASM